MGKFSDQVHNRFSENRKKPSKDVEFSCENCLNVFKFVYTDIYLNKSGDIVFEPEPTCPHCGSRDDIFFTDYSQEKIEDMLFSGKIRRGK